MLKSQLENPSLVHVKELGPGGLIHCIIPCGIFFFLTSNEYFQPKYSEIHKKTTLGSPKTYNLSTLGTDFHKSFGGIDYKIAFYCGIRI